MLRRRMFAGADLTAYAIDDLHSLATAEFEDDPAAVARLNRIYQENRFSYLAEFLTLRAEQAQRT